MAQLTVSGAAVSGDYMIVILVGIVGALLLALAWMTANHFISVIKTINNQLASLTLRADEHDAEINRLDKQFLLMNKSVESFDSQKVADQIFLKLRALQDLK